MERRKSEAREQFKTLKQECDITIELLKKLLDQCSNQIDVIDKLDSTSFRQYSKYFLAVLQFHSLSKQKILTWNFDLEEFLTEQNVPDRENFKNSSNHNNASISESIGTEKFNANSSTSPKELILNKIQSINDANNEINVKDDKTSFKKNFLYTSSSYTCNSDEDFQTLNDILNDSAETNEFHSTCGSVLDKGEPKVEEKCEENNEAIQSSSIEAVVTANPTATEILKALPVMTIEEKCTKSLLEASEDINSSFIKALNFIKASCENSCLEQLSKANNNEIINDTLDDTFHNKTRNFEKFDEHLSQNVSFNNKSTANQNQETLNASKSISLKNKPPPLKGDTCMIGNVESPGEFYAQVVDENIHLIDYIPTKLANLYDNASVIPSTKIDMKTSGNFYAAYIEECWYRVEVLSWMMSHEKRVLIQLVDYGHKYEVEIDILYPLTEELCEIPKMAQRCHLAYLYPPNSTKENRLEDWPEDTMEKVLEVFGDLNESVFKLQHVYYSKERNSYEVDLINTEEANEEGSIGQLLIESGLAVEIVDNDSEVIRNAFIKNQIRTAQGLTGIHHDMPLEEVLDKYFDQTLRSEPENVNDAVMHYNPRDEAETCRNIRPDGTCFKGKRCRLSHVPLTSGFTRDKVPVYNRAFNEYPLPKKDEEIDLSICHVEDIQHFFAQRRNKPNRFLNCIETLPGLIKIMNDEKTKRRYVKLKLPPSMGQMVIVKHWNECWYRGRVRFVEIPENSDNINVEVHIVDFGDVILVPMTDLREILPEFLRLSFQAIECRLYNVKHKSGIDVKDEKCHFEACHLGCTYKAKIMAAPGYLEVLLRDDKDNDIGLKLIEDGFGELRTERFFPHESEVILID